MRNLLAESGYTLSFHRDQWTECVASKETERWRGHGLDEEEALDDLLLKMFPSSLARLLLAEKRAGAAPAAADPAPTPVPEESAPAPAVEVAPADAPPSPPTVASVEPVVAPIEEEPPPPAPVEAASPISAAPETPPAQPPPPEEAEVEAPAVPEPALAEAPAVPEPALAEAPAVPEPALAEAPAVPEPALAEAPAVPEPAEAPSLPEPALPEPEPEPQVVEDPVASDPTEPASAPRIRAAAKSVREEAWLTLPERGLFAVADGLGEGGATASRLAIDGLRLGFADVATLSPVRRKALPALIAAFEQANAGVYEAARRDPSLKGMKAALAAALVVGKQVVLAHAGNSRIYRLRRGVLGLLTNDHSSVNARIRSGKPAGAARSPVTRAVGARKTLEVETSVTTSQPGDVLLLCTAGLHGAVENGELAEALKQAHPEVVVAELVAQASAAGGLDNASAAVIRLPD